MLKPLIATTVLAASTVVAPMLHAQARVEESEPLSGAQVEPSANEGTTTNLQTEMYFRLQSLQEEVLDLRGMVEEQANEIQRLKQQRMDDYLDLDRRIGELTRQIGGGASGGAGAEGAAVNTDGSLGGGGERASETEMYRNAYELLRDRDIDKAIQAFNAYLDEYPKGNFAGNSHYWLGEIYLLNQNLDDAQKWFERLLREFPDDRKRTDAQYKLGRVYHQQGKNQQAQELLQDVASGTSDAARLARQYLEENFQ
ncbi:tol-pal system protein YbgF [Marinimicrobium agarilyticum]|uniref:tol-pal system protein YbgF n=1 Tax=Marinimicrobium agarilyticum TaxID=306546 RepID=UPI000427D02F|nr:tol-pal system protein YbgF [Marinimicrobium agarilyticum]